MKPLGRRKVLWASACLAALALATLNAQAAETALPTPSSLAQAAQAAAAQGEPLVLLVSLPGCPYCELVRRNYLLPARIDNASNGGINSGSNGGLHAWQINVQDRSTPLQGFDGQASTPAAVAKAFRASFTPTVLFLGPDGRELAERLLGTAPDFYGAYLDQRLDAARQALSKAVAQPSAKR